MRWTLTAAAAPQHVIGVSCGHCPGLLVLGLTRQAPGCAALPGRAGPNGRLRYRLEARPKSPILRLSTPRRRRHRDTSPVRRRGRALQPGHARGHRSLNTSGLLLVSTLRFPWTPPLHPPSAPPLSVPMGGRPSSSPPPRRLQPMQERLHAYVLQVELDVRLDPEGAHRRPEHARFRQAHVHSRGGWNPFSAATPCTGGALALHIPMHERSRPCVWQARQRRRGAPLERPRG